MSIKTLATFVLAAGLAAAKPIAVTPAKRQISDISAVVNGFNANNGAFNFIDGFNNFNQQQQVIQIQEQNLQIVDNGRQQQIVQQVNQVLIVDQVNNGFNNDLNNLFRKSNFQNQFRDVATVMLVVQEIQVAIDDGRGNAIQQNIFAQSAVVANRGARETQTVMLFDSRTLIAQDILGNNAFANIGAVGGIAGATAVLDNALPTKTNGIQLFGAKPTWTDVAEDPAETLGAIWQSALEDLQKNENDEKDNALNDLIAAQEQKALQDLLQQGGQKDDGNDDDKQAAEDAAKEQAKQDAEDAAKEDAKKQAEADAQKQAEEEAQKAKDEAQKQADEQKKAEEEAQKQADEQQKTEDEAAKKADEEAKKAADEAAKKQQ